MVTAMGCVIHSLVRRKGNLELGGRSFGSTIGQPVDLRRSRFGLRSLPSVAVGSGEVIKQDQ